VALLRTALAQILKDKDALAEADREKLEIDPVSGEELQSLVEKLYATPAGTLDAIRRLNEGK
jgi:tripartite-type tricarboxylate transporter receptor subunit TctC